MTASGPTPEQRAATDPARSNWVGANAGSGKTQVLTQRVARLLLAGAEPQKILCLTYTKAAASEMQIRLFRTLGDWAMADQARLRAIIGQLTGHDQTPGEDLLTRARRLFARALETPGGLKIQTIHAFCETLLRRFPLEAGVSPRFEVADDLQAGDMVQSVRETMAEAAAAGTDPAFDHAAAQLNEGAIDDLSGAVLNRRDDIAATDLEQALAATFGAEAGMSREEIAADALNLLDLSAFAALKSALLAKGKTTDRPVGDALAGAEHANTAPSDAVSALMDRVLKRDGTERSFASFPTAEVKRTHRDAEPDMRALSAWALETRHRLLSADAAGRARDLHLFGQPLVRGYAQTKTARGRLDFDDLIARTRDLLAIKGQREWVLYKLDQGIDHILVDEAQDTSPAQWQVIRSIADEFFDGEGARGLDRTLFVVGDEKQSIYSFQGAEPATFGQMRRHYSDKLDEIGRPLGRPDLETSFRSAPAILDFVDAVFQGDAAAGLTVDGTPIRHNAHRQGDRGRVDLWPLVPRGEKAEDTEWWRPVDAPPPDDAKARLGDLVAEHIAKLIGQQVLPARGERAARTVAPGDILVLVQRRDRLARGIIRRLKALGVPVAGSDRLKLAKEIAVKDLLALAKVATMPSDDLSLAALLRSPLCNLTEDDLFDLAYDRGKQTLWQRLQDSDGHGDVAAFLKDQLDHADFLRPYEFLERALIHHGGREKLLARLGAEAEDPIDELLSQALIFEQRLAPSIAGLIHWVETSDQVVKREMDQGAGQVRVMTVHGAKGLEAPIVILPDTLATGRTAPGRQLLLRAPATGNAPPLTLWAGAKGDDDPVTRSARDAMDSRAAEERRRLLYVALTRAEDWLILCGAEPGQRSAGTWYELLEQGMDRCAGVTQHPSPTGEPGAEMLRFETGPPAPGIDRAEQPVPPATQDLPGWLTPARMESRRERLSPSALHPHDETGGMGLGRERALLRGNAIHALLERDFDPVDAVAVLTNRFAVLPPEMHGGILVEVAKVRAMPQASTLFSPAALTEVSLAIDPPHGGPRMIGRIDCLAPEGDGWLLVDFKTDAVIPDDPPRAYLAQLGAYVVALQAEDHNMSIKPALLWTTAPRLQLLDPTRAIDAYRTSRRGMVQDA